jgi:Aspartyl protease
MSGRCLVILLALGVGMFNVRSAVAQERFGAVQGIFAEENKNLSRTGSAIQVKHVMLSLTVPVSINGSNTTWWIVDTGAPACDIDPSFSNRLGLQVTEERGFQITKISNFQIGTFHCDGIGCTVRPIGEIKELRLRGWQGQFEKTGVIGINLLARYGALINYRTQQIFLSPSGNLGMSRQKYEAMGFTYVPIVLTPSNRLELVGTIGGTTCSFIIDTGAFATTLDESIRGASKVAFWETTSKMGGPFHDFKNASVSFGTASDFKLGNYDAKGAKLSFASLHLAERGLTHQFGGIIGTDFLYYRAAIIDIGGRALYLKPYSTAH